MLEQTRNPGKGKLSIPETRVARALEVARKEETRRWSTRRPRGVVTFEVFWGEIEPEDCTRTFWYKLFVSKLFPRVA